MHVWDLLLVVVVGWGEGPCALVTPVKALGWEWRFTNKKLAAVGKIIRCCQMHSGSKIIREMDRRRLDAN